MSFSSSLATIALGVISSSALADSDKIVGGSLVTDKSTAAYQHAVRFLNTGIIASSAAVPPALRARKLSWRCSGTIIHERAILSAAHCFPQRLRAVDGSGAPIWVALASIRSEAFFRLNLKEDVLIGAPVEHFERHPGYSDEWMDAQVDVWNPLEPVNDLALVVLKNPIPDDKRAAPLVPKESLPTPQEDLLLVGYGRTIVGDAVEPPQLREVTVPFRQLLKNGKEWYVGSGNIVQPDDETAPEGACAGDSGGSGFRILGGRHFLSGIIVRGPDSGNGGCQASVTIVTDVRAYLPWIHETLSEIVGSML